MLAGAKLAGDFATEALAHCVYLHMSAATWDSDDKVCQSICVLCLLLQDRYGPYTRVNALLFAAPNVGDATFISSYAKVVNTRHFRFLNDLIPQVPCTPTMIGCKDAWVPTSNPRNNGLWPYAATPGTLVLMPSGMPLQADAWSLLNEIYPAQAGRFLRATHTCSYMCYLSQYVVDKNNLFQLWSVPNGSTPVGSYCYSFPVTSGEQYPCSK